MPEPRHVLITRPEPGASETAKRVRSLRRVPVLSPMLVIVPGQVEPGPDVQAILLTSANALVPGLPDRPVLAVGDATATKARQAGFKNVRSAGKDAAALAELVRSACRPDGGTLLLPVAQGQGMPLAQRLRDMGYRVRREVAYVARPVRGLPAPAREFITAGRGQALFFSPETAHVFVRHCRRAGLGGATGGIEALAISPAVATALAPLRWARVRVAEQPTQEALLALLS